MAGHLERKEMHNPNIDKCAPINNVINKETQLCRLENKPKGKVSDLILL